MRGIQRPHPAMLMPTSTKWSYALKVDVSTVRISEAPEVNIAYWRFQFCEYAMRGSQGPHPELLASSSTKWSYVAMFEISTMRILEAPGVNVAYSRTPICEYAMRGIQRPHPAMLMPTSTKWSYALKVDVSTVRISEAPGVNIAFSRTPICEYAMRGNPGPHPTLLVSSCTK